MGYTSKYDANGLLIEEGISGLKRVDVDVSTIKTNLAVSVPKGAYGIIIKKSPIDFEIKINDNDWIPFAEGDLFSPFVKGIESVSITTFETSASPIIMVFII